MRSMSLVVDLIDLVTKHKSGELRCPATALIFISTRHVHVSILDFDPSTPSPVQMCAF